MSPLNLLLSRNEVVLSLVIIGLTLVVVVMLAIVPVLHRSWKKNMARKQAKKAARIARNQKIKRSKQRACCCPETSRRGGGAAGGVCRRLSRRFPKLSSR